MEEKKQEKTEKSEKAKKPVDKEREKLFSELDEAKKLADEYKDKWMRSVAEFDNYKKRMGNLYHDAFADGVSSVIVKILVIGDNLEW
ncbi:MAG: nucleotide exchange factor GrpE, partial [Clostridia bacterium]|nr:nucleotide exchange factor GrpE [Clostridia bacterium]